MNVEVFSVYYIFIILALATGIFRYRYLDATLRFIVAFLVIVVTSEALSFIADYVKAYNMRYVLYHIYSIPEILLLSTFYYSAIKLYHLEKTIIVTFLFWILIASINILFYQPIYSLNTNVVLIESFVVITMSLYYIYWLLKKDTIKNIFGHPHFQIAILLLISWSGTLFFWAFIGILYHDGWEHSYSIMIAHTILNTLVYGGIAAVFFFHPKKQIAHGDS